MGREDLLKSVAIFSELSRGDLSRLAKVMVPRTIKSGDAVIEENDQAAGFFIVSSGKLEAERNGQTLATYGPRDFFGEMALFEGFPRSATVRAIEDSECLAMTRWDFTAEMKNRPQIAVGMLPVLVRRLREADERIAD